ncbi:MAG: acyl-CoA dehydrogenase family protein, partial [Deltaproteobacteria bacterium]|nr:acyl-CoA dehydrogenase family protein [Deltaproteobacteria bacterium]
MDFTFTPEQEELRNEFTEWLKKTLPADWDPANQPKFETIEEMKTAYQDFQKKLFDAGYAAMHYPKEYGGGGKTVNEELIILQTISNTCYSLKAAGTITHAMAVPVIYECGSEEQ